MYCDNFSELDSVSLPSSDIPSSFFLSKSRCANSIFWFILVLKFTSSLIASKYFLYDSSDASLTLFSSAIA